MPPRHIAVLGAGITGLSAAFHLSRRLPHTPLTVLEKTTRAGGWINSRRVDVHDDIGNTANVCLESGPRTLRPNSRALLELIHLLGLTPALVTMPRSAPAARRRFLHLPESGGGLEELPASLWGALTLPFARRLLLPAMLCEPWRRANRPAAAEEDDDEPFEALLARRFGAEPARVLGSALVHGVYAADARVLSARAAFPALLDAEARGGGSIGRGLLRRAPRADGEGDYELGDVARRMDGVAVYSFVDGIETLTRALRNALQKTPNVTFRTGAEVIALRARDRSDDVEIRTYSGHSTIATHVVSTVPLPLLEQIIAPSAHLPHLRSNPTSTVTVLNLVFPPTPVPLHPAGFGYLVPRPAAGYTAADPGILGAVFDSCALGAQDRGAPFTKLTVMLGGPHTAPAGNADVPAVLAHLTRQLGARAPLPPPVLTAAREQRACIPAPAVGHVRRMRELRGALLAAPWRGRLAVVGAGVDGVSVGDCVEAGRNVGRDWL